jgi:hypothetical protein
MSDFVRSFDRRLTWAVLASLALHLWLAAVFPSGTAAENPPAVFSLARVARISIVRRTPSPPPPRVARAVRRASARAAPISNARRGLRSAVRAARPVQAVAPQIAAAPPTVVPTIVPPTPAPLPARARAAGGYMPFGAQENDPVLDPRVLQALRRLGVHTTLTIQVGEDGKTQSVAFSPALDAQTESVIESALAAANWDPAYCGGGIPCAKKTTIAL